MDFFFRIQGGKPRNTENKNDQHKDDMLKNRECKHGLVLLTPQPRAISITQLVPCPLCFWSCSGHRRRRCPARWRRRSWDPRRKRELFGVFCFGLGVFLGYWFFLGFFVVLVFFGFWREGGGFFLGLFFGLGGFRFLFGICFSGEIGFFG